MSGYHPASGHGGDSPFPPPDLPWPVEPGWTDVSARRTLGGRNFKSIARAAPHPLPRWPARFLTPAALLEKGQRQEPQPTQDGHGDVNHASAL